MKKFSIWFLLILNINMIFSQSVKEWENCTEGINMPMQSLNMFKFENTLFLPGTKPYPYTTDGAQTWRPGKNYDSAIGRINYISKNIIFKYKDTYISNSTQGLYYSKGGISDWQRINYLEPQIENTLFFFLVNSVVSDSNLVARFRWSEKQDSLKSKIRYRTCVARNFDNSISGTIQFDTIPEFKDYSVPDDYLNCNYSRIEDTLYVIHNSNKGSYLPYYFFSLDNGESWSKKEILNEQGQAIISGGIKSIVKLNNNIFIVSPLSFWKQEINGEYKEIKDSKFDNFLVRFLTEHQGHLFAQAIDSNNHKPILVRSDDGSNTWSNVGDKYFTILNLISLDNKLIANTVALGILISTDNGLTWEESNNGLYSWYNSTEAFW